MSHAENRGLEIHRRCDYDKNNDNEQQQGDCPFRLNYRFAQDPQQAYPQERPIFSTQ